jgi:hypothetical protein
MREHNCVQRFYRCCQPILSQLAQFHMALYIGPMSLTITLAKGIIPSANLASAWRTDNGEKASD